MAKKKVSKSSSKASKVRKKKSNHNNKTKLENLELAANIAVKDAKTEVPIIETKTAQVQDKSVPVKETMQQKAASQDVPPDSAIVQPDPIYADNLQPNISVKTLDKHLGETTQGMKIIVLVVIAIIVLFWVMVIALAIVPNADKIVEKNVSVTITEPITINFGRYSNVTSQLASTDSSLVGYLSEETISDERSAAPATKYYILDDYGNKVELVLDYQEKQTYDLWFKDGTVSKETYNVTGAFRYDQYAPIRYQFSVDNITQQDRPEHTIETMRLRNVTVEGRGFTIDIATGWKKITGKK